MPHEDHGSRIIVSYLTLRKMVGALGLFLPLVLAVGWMLYVGRVEVLPAVSSYYATLMRDVFVGILFVAAFFLFAYRGHDPSDNVLGAIAGTFALGVALAPISSPHGFVQAVHLFSGAGLFLALAGFSIVLFTRTHEDRPPTPEKLSRNRLYRFCGWVMVGCVVGIGVHMLFLQETWLDDWKPVFCLETLALVLFGVSWLIKGETLLQDKPHQRIEE